MPNGHRQSFRISLEEGWEDRDERDGTPSPIHTSDSEDTDYNKTKWILIAKRVVRRWLRFARCRARIRRALFFLDRFNFFPGLPDEAVQGVAKYM